MDFANRLLSRITNKTPSVKPGYKIAITQTDFPDFSDSSSDEDSPRPKVKVTQTEWST